MAALRYLLFAAVGVAIASLLFLVMNFIVTANFDAGVGVVERWIVRATCEQYELSGTVRGTAGRPVPFAVVEVSYPDERLTTRSNSDGTFMLAAAAPVCDRRPPASVQLVVVADGFRPKTQAVPFETASIEVTLDARDFRP
ncbi:MAG TPA: carboxypeptidase-like regulatory domain-containing protein [Gammaproteobacteria bacterium]|nr:carboxypeptidase-like regulatory domain-containing protein [Gammaproteobacteria bacterium]